MGPRTRAHTVTIFAIAAVDAAAPGVARAEPEPVGTTALPDGFGVSVGGAQRPIAARSGTATDGPDSTAYAAGDATAAGLWASTSYEHRNLVIAIDAVLAHAAQPGILRPLQASSGVMPYADSVMDMSSELRIGARIPTRFVAFAAGTGAGVELVDHVVATTDQTAAFASPPHGETASFFIPVWAAVTFKVACNFGTQALVSYDVHPGSSADHGASVSLGFLWQPSRACVR